MAEMWMPGASKRPVGNEGAMNGGPSRATWHITSNDSDHNFENEVGYFTSGGADVAPHLIWDPFTGQIAQLFPADSRSLSLKNAGDVKTNRTGQYNIQIEIVFTEGEVVNGKTYHSVAETPCKGLDGIVAWLRSLGIADVWPNGVPKGFYRQDVSVDFWLSHGGHYGHNMVPGNDHVDPGPMPDLFKGGTPVPTPIYAPFPGAGYFYLGRTSSLITELGKALVRAGYKGYRVGPGPVFSPADKRGVQWFQQQQGWSGPDADGIPGPETWKRLKVAQPR